MTMQRLLDMAQFSFYLAGILVMLWVGNAITSNLLRLERELDRNALVHDQMLKDHLRALQEHERLMQR
jgi:hypothetical protein